MTNEEHLMRNNGKPGRLVWEELCIYEVAAISQESQVCYMTLSQNSCKPCAAQGSQTPLDEGNDCGDAGRALSTVAAPFCKNNQKFGHRDLK